MPIVLNTLNIMPKNDTVAVSPICGRPLVKLDAVARLTTPCPSKVSLSLPGIELRPEVLLEARIGVDGIVDVIWQTFYSNMGAGTRINHS